MRSSVIGIFPSLVTTTLYAIVGAEERVKLSEAAPKASLLKLTEPLLTE